jgi:hypothetical protein
MKGGACALEEVRDNVARVRAAGVVMSCHVMLGYLARWF